MTKIKVVGLIKKNILTSVASVAQKCCLFYACCTISMICFNCASRQQIISVYEVSDPEHNLHSYMMSGNFIQLDSLEQGYRVCSLNPGRIQQGDQKVYFALNFIYKGEKDSVVITKNDSLILFIDATRLDLTTYDIQNSTRGTSAFYEISPYDLVDLGNANQVLLQVTTRDKILSARLSPMNIYNFKRFASRFVLLSDHQPARPQPAQKIKWGFVSMGLGSGYEVWLGKYTDIFTAGKDNRLHDFLAINAGFSTFSYDIKGFRRFWEYDPANPQDSTLAIRFWTDKPVDENYPYLGFMYGLKLERVISDWSLETGVTAQYFFLPQWQYPVDSVYVPEQDKFYPEKIYQLTSGTPYDGFCAGIFFQVGGLWARINTKKAWAIGLALPVPWW
jgi:hypothetical protein